VSSANSCSWWFISTPGRKRPHAIHDIALPPSASGSRGAVCLAGGYYSAFAACDLPCRWGNRKHTADPYETKVFSIVILASSVVFRSPGPRTDPDPWREPCNSARRVCRPSAKCRQASRPPLAKSRGDDASQVEEHQGREPTLPGTLASYRRREAA
jgi:hypothetical protein